MDPLQKSIEALEKRLQEIEDEIALYEQEDHTRIESVQIYCQVHTPEEIQRRRKMFQQNLITEYQIAEAKIRILKRSLARKGQ